MGLVQVAEEMAALTDTGNGGGDSPIIVRLRSCLGGSGLGLLGGPIDAGRGTGR